MLVRIRIKTTLGHSRILPFFYSFTRFGMFNSRPCNNINKINHTVSFYLLYFHLNRNNKHLESSALAKRLDKFYIWLYLLFYQRLFVFE